MRYSALWVLALGFSISMAARADFGGSWSGTGDISGGLNIHCSDMSMTVIQTDTEVDITDAQVDCSFISQSFDSESYVIEGSDLYQNNEKVGTIDAQNATAAISGSSYTGTVSMTLTSDDTANFAVDINRGGTVYHLTATVTRSE